MLLFLLIPIHDTRPETGQAAYDHALRLFHSGFTAAAQTEAAAGSIRYRNSDPALAIDFELLDAQILTYVGQSENALKVLAEIQAGTGTTDDAIDKLTIEASALAKLHQAEAAETRLKTAEGLCRSRPSAVCVRILAVRGMLGVRQGQMEKARGFYLAAYNDARQQHDTWIQSLAGLNMGYTALHLERLDEAVDWSRTTYQLTTEHGYEDLAETTAGNLGYAWYSLGDREQALTYFQEAETSALRVGDLEDARLWLSTTSYVYQDQGDLAGAESLRRQALAIAKKIGDQQEQAGTLADLTEVLIDEGKLNEADALLRDAMQMETAEGHKPRIAFILVSADLAVARKDFAKAEPMFRTVLSDASSTTIDRLSADNSLALLYEQERKTDAAERMYKAAIGLWDSARAQLRRDELELSFGSNASYTYRNYVRFLVQHGKTAEALAVADQSRARTLADGLHIKQGNDTGLSGTQQPEQVARKANATLLFYWLGETESYLWAVTPEKTALFKLPTESVLAQRVESYNKAILDLRDPLATGNPDGKFLYSSLVAPARGLIDAHKPVIVVSDGALSRLNLETLPVPEDKAADTKAHYLIEDWTLISAPSLELLARGDGAAQKNTAGKMLLIGDPVVADADFPPLPYFATEMTRVRNRFDAGETEIFEGAQATPAAYATAEPAKFDYIHFVSHATASKTSPLDSAIILSSPGGINSSGPGGAYKLYAREIVQHPLDARLVTISTCYGSGTRAYAGEGLVGLSWAFLRAGARQVIAALWEVSDDSNPRLMDGLYKGIDEGKPPAEALRDAKLELLRSGTRFSQPFFWAPFQVYSRE